MHINITIMLVCNKCRKEIKYKEDLVLGIVYLSSAAVPRTLHKSCEKEDPVDFNIGEHGALMGSSAFGIMLIIFAYLFLRNLGSMSMQDVLVSSVCILIVGLFFLGTLKFYYTVKNLPSRSH